MRGKMLLYAYLYGLSSKVSSITPDLVTRIPDEFKLFNNYPNPFNLKTKITYNLPENSKVKIEVYNIAGRRVKTLINDDKKAGSYEIIFDGSELPSGIYLCILEAGKYRDTKKMILLK